MAFETWPQPGVQNIENPAEKVEEVESVEDIEQELSPEQIELIMAKVEDINAKGNAFSVITLCRGQEDTLVTSLPKLKNILSDGLLGHSYYWPEERKQRSVVDKDSWAKNTRLHKNALVNFNITGRMLYMEDSEFQVANSAWMKDYDHNDIAVLFDHSKYKEDAPITEATENKLETRTFRIHERYADIEQADSMLGFTLSHRVPPRFFKGLVIKLVTGEKHENQYGDLHGEECRDPARYNDEASKIGKIMQKIYQNKKDLLLPIYDHYGSLRWPKQMDYEEVKKFVTERDNRKRQY